MENKFCQEPSNKYLEALEDEGGDPRSVAGRQAIKDLGKFGHWMPTIDSRDASITGPEEKEPSKK
jgi:hypothetical protein